MLSAYLMGGNGKKGGGPCLAGKEIVAGGIFPFTAVCVDTDKKQPPSFIVKGGKIRARNNFFKPFTKLGMTGRISFFDTSLKGHKRRYEVSRIDG